MTDRRLRVVSNWEKVPDRERHVPFMRLCSGDDALGWFLNCVRGMDARWDAVVAVGERVDSISKEVALVVVSAEATFLDL